MTKGPLLALLLLFVTPVAVVVAVLGILIVIVTGAASASSSTPSGAALADIPANLLPVYQAAAERCAMPWAVVAAVGKIESDHGRSQAQGVHSGANFAGASGPMQFLAATWRAYGVDGDGDEVADVYNPVDAIHGAANYLCANGAGEGDPARLRSAIWNYNHAEWYVNKVLAQAAEYEEAAASTIAGDYTVPLAASTPGLSQTAMAKPHHDYPAWDFATPTGTPILAAAAGMVAATTSSGACGNGVVIDGTDGHRYTYCHGVSTGVARGESVAVGQQIMLSGSSGRSTGPHLHFQIVVGGTKVCPQTLLLAWSEGIGTNPASAPTSGCTS
ncbi:MAG: peptidoglycan DD-metalloendopeptidase family protein [Acidimicrobiia bacterium]|nr:peptidoglycan DD-metalloendopeptidase family protein [Acidimicrobiia bacterium]